MWKSDYASEKLSDVDLLVGVVLMARSHMRIARVLGTWKRGLECFFEADSLTKDGNDTNGIKQGLFGSKRILCVWILTWCLKPIVGNCLWWRVFWWVLKTKTSLPWERSLPFMRHAIRIDRLLYREVMISMSQLARARAQRDETEGWIERCSGLSAQ